MQPHPTPTVARLVALLAAVALASPAVAQEAAAPVAPVAAESGPTVEIGAHGLSVSSPDGRFALGLRGWAQLSGRFYVADDDELGTNGLFARRVRPILDLRVARDLSLRVMPDLASGITLLDAYANWTPTGVANLRFGSTKTPLGFELLQSPTATPFVERGLPTGLVPNRDVGLLFYGETDGALLQYQAGVFNGGLDGANGGQNLGDQFDVVARLFVQPFARADLPALAGLGLGVAGSWGEETGTSSDPALPRYAAAGRRTFFRYATDGTLEGVTRADGRRLRAVAHLYYHAGGFDLLGELALTWQEVTRSAESAELQHTAWQARAAYAIGGEASASGVRPGRDVTDGGLGALQLKFRAGQLRLDSAAFPAFAQTGSAETATELAGGVNWWLSRNARLIVDYYHTAFDAPSGGQAPPDEDAVVATVQLGL